MRARLDFLRPGMPRNISRAVEDVKVPGEGRVLPGSAFSCVVTRIFGVCSTDLRLDTSTKGPKEVYRSSATILKKNIFWRKYVFQYYLQLSCLKFLSQTNLILLTFNFILKLVLFQKSWFYHNKMVETKSFLDQTCFISLKKYFVFLYTGQYNY
jgi:hypothetical protein